MFGRKIQMEFVKDQKAQDDPNKMSFGDWLSTVNVNVNTRKLALEIVVVMGTYMILDTFRKVAIEQAKHTHV